MYRCCTWFPCSKRRIVFVLSLAFIAIVWPWSPALRAAHAGSSQRGEEATKVFRAGAFAIDITPLGLPVLVNGGVRERLADQIHARLRARCLVLDDGRIQLAIAVVDSCLIPRSLADEAKAIDGDQNGRMAHSQHTANLSSR